MKNNRCVIFDAAHGKDVGGKSSPDNVHKEYIWSREQIVGISRDLLYYKGLNFDIFFDSVYNENEIGLENRVKNYNIISRQYDNTLVISLHNNAEPKKTCNSDGWGKANGIEVFTSRGEDGSDDYATSLVQHLEKCYPEKKFRKGNWLSNGEKIIDPDKEADFTILAGNELVTPEYDAILLEHLFMTNYQEYLELMDKRKNRIFQKNIVNWLLEIHS